MVIPIQQRKEGVLETADDLKERSVGLPRKDG